MVTSRIRVVKYDSVQRIWININLKLDHEDDLELDYCTVLCLP